MRVLLIGSGGREHAMADSILKSKAIEELYILPGNYGTSKLGTNVNIDISDNEKIVEFAKNEKIDLTIVGPEVPIINGLANDFIKADLKIFSPTKESGQIEGSKIFAKHIMEKYEIPTGEYREFNDYNLALNYVFEKKMSPCVIKYDGLASGKGVYICDTLDEIRKVLKLLLMDKILGDANVIIEEFLDGEEFTLMAFVKNEKVYTMPVARDFKRVYNKDKGDNTGGMGCICPYDKISDRELEEAEAILKSTASAMVKEGVPFTGILYGGFISTNKGVKVIEYNARFGDPETEVVLQKIESSLLDIIVNLLEDRPVEIKLNEGVYTGVVITAKGYPSTYVKDIDMSEFLETGFTTYHMSTYEKDGKALSSGGRVLCITNSDKDAKSSYSKIYSSLEKIQKENLHYRTDLNNY